jgi:hypothetical protein
MSINLVANRQCGECTICCYTLQIEEEDLKKQADSPCHHLIENQGCSIYKKRPNVCSNWYCGWRLLDFLEDEFRPDKSGLLLRVDKNEFVFQALINPFDVLTKEKTLTIIAASIEFGIKVFISVPTKMGFCNSKIEITKILEESVKTCDLQKTQIIMRDAIKYGINQETDSIKSF